MHLQQIFKAVSAARSTARNVADDIGDSSKDITTTVGKESRSLDVAHLGDLMVQLDKVSVGFAARNSVEAFFHNSTFIVLGRSQSLFSCEVPG